MRSVRTCCWRSLFHSSAFPLYFPRGESFFSLNYPQSRPFVVNFRKAHEQLRTVIVRVLRPSTVHGASANDAVIDAADLSAIEEVNVAYEDVKSVDVLDLTPAGTQTWETAKRRYGLEKKNQPLSRFELWCLLNIAIYIQL